MGERPRKRDNDGRPLPPGVFRRGPVYAVIYRDGKGRQRQRSAPDRETAEQLRAELDAQRPSQAVLNAELAGRLRHRRALQEENARLRERIERLVEQMVTDYDHLTICFTTNEDGSITAQVVEYPAAISQGPNRKSAFLNVLNALQELLRSPTLVRC